MLTDRERSEMARLYRRKLDQDARKLPKAERHRNLEPGAAELLCALAAGLGARRMVEVGGSSGISTIALAVAARATGGRLDIHRDRAAAASESKETLTALGLAEHVEYLLADASLVLPSLADLDLAFIDCEKDDYIRFFDMLQLVPGAVIVADNILSHGLADYVAHVRRRPGIESITLPVGKGLEVSRLRRS